MKKVLIQEGELISFLIVRKGYRYKLFNLFLADPIKFGGKSDLKDTECWKLLNEHMPDLMRERKISQRLFIK